MQTNIRYKIHKITTQAPLVLLPVPHTLSLTHSEITTRGLVLFNGLK